MLLVVGAVVVVGGAAYWYFQLYGGAPVGDVPTETAGTQVPVSSSIDPKIEAQVAEILHAIDTVHNLNLDTKFFEDKRFTALQETSVVIPDITPVNKHPFEFAHDAVLAPSVKR